MDAEQIWKPRQDRQVTFLLCCAFQSCRHASVVTLVFVSVPRVPLPKCPTHHYNTVTVGKVGFHTASALFFNTVWSLLTFSLFESLWLLVLSAFLPLLKSCQWDTKQEERERERCDMWQGPQPELEVTEIVNKVFYLPFYALYKSSIFSHACNLVPVLSPHCSHTKVSTDVHDYIRRLVL